MNTVDLGLPSGTLWSTTLEEGLFSYPEAVTNYGEHLPRAWQIAELREECKPQWLEDPRGVLFTGPNGNTIFVPAVIGPKKYPESRAAVIWSLMPFYCNEAFSLNADNFSVQNIQHISRDYRACVLTCESVPRLRTEVSAPYVDLGLTSGTIWKETSEPGLFFYNQMLRLFGEQVPKAWQLAELREECSWVYDPEQVCEIVTGPSGSSICLPMSRRCEGDIARGSWWSRFRDSYRGVYYIGADEYFVTNIHQTNNWNERGLLLKR